MGSKSRQAVTVERLADRLHSAAIHLLRRLRREDDVSGLSASRLSALSVIVFGGPVTIGDLAAAEQVRLPTISRLVKGLERDGLVMRRADRDDARIQWLRATPQGRRLLETGRARRVTKLAGDLQRLPAADRRLLARAAGILEKIARPQWVTGAASDDVASGSS